MKLKYIGLFPVVRNSSTNNSTSLFGLFCVSVEFVDVTDHLPWTTHNIRINTYADLFN